MLKAILNGQTALSSKIDKKVDGLRKKINEKFDEANKEFDEVNKRIDETNKRIDSLGFQLAELDSDAPTGEDFEKLEKWEEKVEVFVAGL